jgi:long-chain fatty acid transport protein
MHQRRLSVYFALLSISMALTVANAQGFQVNFQGQKQQGMGCAGSGLIQDASTLFFNPAGASFVPSEYCNNADFRKCNVC